MSTLHRITLLCLSLLTAFGTTQSVNAMETEVALNQDVATMGGATPGDAPGFPITITRPGRYVLTSNLYPDFDKVGIEVNAYDVTIDFNGFILHGGFQAYIGIYTRGFNTAMIMNGLIAGFQTLAIAGNDSWVVDNMRISANVYGVKLGNYARVQRSTFTLHQSYGLYCDDGCHVEGNVISKNYEGVHINSGTVLGNTITSNKTFGIISNSTSASSVGFGNNTLWLNNLGGMGGSTAQVRGVALKQLQPNVCSPAC